jgi:hypothetical protein
MFLVGSQTAPLNEEDSSVCPDLNPQQSLDIDQVSALSGRLIGRLLNNSTSTTKTM